MAKLKTAFDKAVAESKQLPEKPDNMTLLKIYALYKQATEGDVEGTRRLRQALGAKDALRGAREPDDG